MIFCDFYLTAEIMEPSTHRTNENVNRAGHKEKGYEQKLPCLGWRQSSPGAGDTALGHCFCTCASGALLHSLSRNWNQFT